MSLISEVSLIRLRQRASKLYWPTAVLAGVSFTLAITADGIDPELKEISYWVAIAVVVIFWFFPVLSYLFSYLELTNQRLRYRFGFLGLKKREVELSQISSIEITRPTALGGKVIVLTELNQNELWLSGYARTKLLAAEIERLARAV